MSSKNSPWFFAATSLYSIRWKAGNSWPYKFFLDISTKKKNEFVKTLRSSFYMEKITTRIYKKKTDHCCWPFKKLLFDVLWHFLKGILQSKKWQQKLISSSPSQGSQPQRPQWFAGPTCSWTSSTSHPVNHQVSQRQVWFDMVFF